MGKDDLSNYSVQENSSKGVMLSFALSTGRWFSQGHFLLSLSSLDPSQAWTGRRRKLIILATSAPVAQ
jgi:hypothetical protein